jgi:ribosome maturation factor RimP
MNLFEKNIRDLILEVVERNNFLLIETVIRGHGNNRVIEVFIDAENYVSADDCSKVNREINERVKNTVLAQENYRLEVSSPGTDRPLKYLKQFSKHINRKFDLSYKINGEIKKATAVLAEINDDELKFITNNNNVLLLKFNTIVKAKVIISFS